MHLVCMECEWLIVVMLCCRDSGSLDVLRRRASRKISILVERSAHNPQGTKQPLGKGAANQTYTSRHMGTYCLRITHFHNVIHLLCSVQRALELDYILEPGSYIPTRVQLESRKTWIYINCSDYELLIYVGTLLNEGAHAVTYIRIDGYVPEAQVTMNH